MTAEILRAAFEVAGTIGHGFLEGVYQRALAYELELAGLTVLREAPFRVMYKGREMGTYIADLIIEGRIIVELKAIEAQLGAAHVAQCLNYLRASGLKTALLINFGRPHIDYKRVSL